MTMFAGLDVGDKRTAVCILDEVGKIVWRGMADTHPEMIDAVPSILARARQRETENRSSFVVR